MVRRIIEIDQEKCNGCGACAAACHEGAIGMVDGKAVLLLDRPCMKSLRRLCSLLCCNKGGTGFSQSCV